MGEVRSGPGEPRPGPAETPSMGDGHAIDVGECYDRVALDYVDRIAGEPFDAYLARAGATPGADDDAALNRLRGERT